MVSISPSRTARLFVTQLEDRCVMTTLPWPVAAADNLGLTVTYGQFDDRTAGGQVGRGIHFHEGIDILVSVGTKVYAIEAGTVAKVNNNVANPYQSSVSIATNAGSGWNYIHISPAVAAGAAVKQGDLIGTVAAAPGVLPHHLHLDATTGAVDPSFNPPLLRPVADPLARLTPLGDTIPPTLGDIHFMRAEDDSNNPHNLTGGSKTLGPHLQMQDETLPLASHGYFKALDHSSAVIVGHRATAETNSGVKVGGSSNIDLIAKTLDQMTAGGHLLGVRSV